MNRTGSNGPRNTAKVFEAPTRTQQHSSVRTTIIIPSTVDQNLEVCRLKLGVSKNEVIKRALSEFLINQDFQPDKSPKNFSVSY